jgi:cytochrome P450
LIRYCDEAWLATRYDEVKSLLGDPRLGLSHPDPRSAARISDSVLFGGAWDNFETEAADHARFRSLLAPYFSPRAMQAMRPRVEALVDERLEEFSARTPPVDLRDALSLPVSVSVICELLGVPYEDRGRFREWSEDLAVLTDRSRSEAAMAELLDYMMRLVQRKRMSPGDDMITGLCRAEDGGLDDAYISYMAAVMLFAGHETTVARIDRGVLLLLANPDQHRALLDDPGLLPGAVEEILRAAAFPWGAVPRYAREDIDVGGVTVRAGEAVLLDPVAADYDERVFAEPDRFDITRAPNHHVAFGHGPRYCIGAPLSRIELEAVFARLIPRFPTLRLAVPIERMRIRRDLLTGGLAQLPVTW